MLDCKSWWVPNDSVFSRFKNLNTLEEKLIFLLFLETGECGAWSWPAEVAASIWPSAFHSSSLPSDTVIVLEASAFVCFVSLWDYFLMTDREMLTLTSQPIPIKTHRLWLMALLVCGFAQMGLHLSQDPCCLHSDPQRMVIQQLSFVNVRCFFFCFVLIVFVFLFVFLLASHSQLHFFAKNPLHYLCLDVILASIIGIHSFIYFVFLSS